MEQRPMKLCIDCKHYGGVKASNGKYICNEPRNCFQHPVDGLEHAYDASWLRMAQSFNRSAAARPHTGGRLKREFA